jgi:hypothetical protein
MSPLHGHFKTPCHGYGIITVAVKDGCIECLPKIGRVRCRSTIDRIGRKTNLIIYYYVYRPPNIKVIHTGKLHCFVHNALPSKGGVSMQEDRNDITSILFCITTVELLRAGLAKNYGIDTLKMGWVGNETKVNLPPIGIGPIYTRAEMVLKELEKHIE